MQLPERVVEHPRGRCVHDGNNWTRGFDTYFRGRVVGFVPPLMPLAVRQIGPKFLLHDERIKIADVRHAGFTIREIADQLERAHSPISRELPATRSGSGVTVRSMPVGAAVRRSPRHRCRIETQPRTAELFRELTNAPGAALLRLSNLAPHARSSLPPAGTPGARTRIF
ncbi:MAG: hypothetical protein DLM57_03170 [Pseudonocardiales bacterium]|nr:MAG: hypothetical protein DLM57_03170 [Pseudonocardiales bacterium]